MKDTMHLVTAQEDKGLTFFLMPSSNQCPYNEASFDPKSKILTVIGKDTYETFMMVNRLKPNGKLWEDSAVEGGIQQERILVQRHFSYRIKEENEIRTFVALLTGKNDLDLYFTKADLSGGLANIPASNNAPLSIVHDGPTQPAEEVIELKSEEKPDNE